MEAASDFLANIGRTIATFSLLTCFTLMPGAPRAAAQISPGLDPAMIMQAPVRTTDPGSVAVEWMRIFLELTSDHGTSTGTASVWASAGPDSLLVLNVADLDILEVLLPESDSTPEWRVERGRLYVAVPDSTDDLWRVDVRYRIRSAFNSTDSDGQPTVIWTSSLPGRATWMPLPVDEISAMDIQMSIAAPPSWKVVLAGMDASDDPMELDGRRIIRTSFEAVYPRAVGFVAWHEDADDALQQLTMAEALDGFGLDAEWMTRVLALDAAAPITVLSVPGESIPASFIGCNVQSTGGLDRGNEWMRNYERLWRNYQLILTPTLGRLAPTDYWIETGLSAWLSVERIRNSQSDAAAGLVLDELRQRYLSESKLYQRPLVWDRWQVAADLRDRHAEAKGAWVFRMLHERLGSAAFDEALQRFFELARHQVVDSETLRTQFEVVSREDLGDFFDTWVYAAGHPVISLSYQFDPDTEQTNLRLVQHQEGSLVPETFVFDAAFQYSTLAETNSVTLRVDERDRTTRIPTGIAPRFIHPDALANVPLDFEETPGKADLVSQLRYSMDAASTVRSLHLLSTGALDPMLLLGLRSAITEATDPVVLAETAPVLGRMAPSASALGMLIEWTRHEDFRVRAAAVEALGSFEGSADAYDAALQVANSGSEAVELAAAVRTLAHLRPDRAWPVLRAALVTPSEGEQVRITALEMIRTDTADDGDMADAILPLLDGTPDVGAAALRCLARLFPEGPRTTRQADAWLLDASSIRREAAISVIEQRDVDDLPAERIRQALAREPDIGLRRRLEALESRLEGDPDR